MTHLIDREDPVASVVDYGFSVDDVCLVLNALWVWRGQLGRVGSGQPIQGLGTAEASKNVGEIARKLGGDPDAYFFGLNFPQCH